MDHGMCTCRKGKNSMLISQIDIGCTYEREETKCQNVNKKVCSYTYSPVSPTKPLSLLIKGSGLVSELE